MTNNSFTLPTGQTFSIFVPNETIPSTEFKRGLSYEQVEPLVRNTFSQERIDHFKQIADASKIIYYPEQNPL